MIQDDVDRIMAVMEAAFDPDYGEAWTRRQVEDALALPGTHFLLAAEGGNAPSHSAPVVGFALSRGAADEEELLLIAVSPGYRSQGTGSGLLTRWIAEARERGKKRLFLEMRDGNEAERLYLRHGFEKIGRRPNYYRRGAGLPRDAITFAL